MGKSRAIEGSQIRYHITYDENLTFKDLEDLLHLIRISNNDVLHKMGVPKRQVNGLQRIENVDSGSIEIVLEAFEKIIEVINDVATVISAIGFVHESVKAIINKIKARAERPARNPREDRKVHDKYEIIIEIEERPSNINENATIYVIHIHICNRKLMNL